MKTLSLLLSTAALLHAGIGFDNALEADSTGTLFEASDFGTTGSSMAMSGNYLVAGTNNYYGAQPTIVYCRNGESWTKIQELVPSDNIRLDGFGQSVDLSEDARWLVVGMDDTGELSQPASAVKGGAYVYRLNASTGRYEFLQKLVPPSSSVGDMAGFDVAVSGDWLAMGAPNDQTQGVSAQRGAVYLYQLDQGSGCWVERQKILMDTFGDEFGRELDLSGANLAVGSTGDFEYLKFYRRDVNSNEWFKEDFLEAGDGDYDHIRPQFSGDWLIERQQCCDSEVRVHRRNPSAPQDVPFPDESTWEQVGNPIATVVDGTAFTLSENFAVVSLSSTLGVYQFDGTLWNQIGSIPKGTSSYFLQILAENGNLVATVDPQFELPSYNGRSYTASATNVAAHIDGLIDYNAAGPGLAEKEAAAFAFQQRLYDNSTGPYLTRHNNIDTYYGASNEANADLAEGLAREGYLNSRGAGRGLFEARLLDIAYGRASVELIRSKNTLRVTGETRMAQSPVGLTIDGEISSTRQAHEQAEAGLEVYLQFFEDDLGVGLIDGEPAGKALFAKQVPQRKLFSAIDSNQELLDGYKDLVLFYDLLVQYARTSSDLAYLLIARDGAGDAAEAGAIIGDAQRLVFEQRILLDGLFDDSDLTPARKDELGITELGNDIDAALSELSTFEQGLRGTINLLGYEPDFLLLFQRASIHHSFDAYKDLLDLNDAASPLTRAEDAREDADIAIQSYNANLSSLESQFADLRGEGSSPSGILPRLSEIAGADYGTPDYDHSENNDGSLVKQHLDSIEVARLRIDRNRVEISNLHEKIRIENQRRAAEAGINATLSDQIIDWGNQQASMTEEIGRIEAAQAAADGLSDTIGDFFSIPPNPARVGLAIVGVVNTAVQTGGEVGKGNLEASKERLAATQEAEVRKADDAILNNNSAALVRTLLLEMNTLAIDSQEAAILLRQEVGRIAGLLREKEGLERRLKAVENRLAASYFGDPTHRLRALNETELANVRFENAREWLFFAARALEYKWNTPFDLRAEFSRDGRRWVLRDLFRLRNSDELVRFFEALIDFDTRTAGGRDFIARKSWFSLREDYFGYDLADDATLAPLYYDVINPATGLVENVDAIQAFRYELQRMLEDCDGDGSDEICLRFDSFRQLNYSTSTNAGQGGFLSSFFSKTTYLDRITNVRVFIKVSDSPLAGSDGSNVLSNAKLSYLGTSMVRNEQPGTPNTAGDRIVGEFTAYPSRFYRFFPDGYRFQEGYTEPNVNVLKYDSSRDRTQFETGIYPTEVASFAERSVATTGWQLLLEQDAGLETNSRLVIDEIDDIELLIRHESVNRQ